MNANIECIFLEHVSDGVDDGVNEAIGDDVGEVISIAEQIRKSDGD